MVDDVAGVAVVVVPHGDIETDVVVSVGIGAVEIEVQGGEGVFCVKGEAACQSDIGRGGVESVAVFGSAVVVGVVVVEYLCKDDSVVLRVVVSANAFAQSMDYGVGGGLVVGGYGQGEVEWRHGMGCCGLIGVVAPVNGSVFQSPVIGGECLTIVVVDGVAVGGGQLFGETVGDGEWQGVAHVGGGELSCGHGLVVPQQ